AVLPRAASGGSHARRRVADEGGEAAARVRGEVVAPVVRGGVAVGQLRAPAETLNLSPRTKPQSVIPHASASSTARLDGAETPASTAAPARAAFCTSS